MRETSNIPDETMYSVQKYYNTIARVVRSHFESDNWHVIVTNNIDALWKSINGSTVSNLAGFCTTKMESIYIANRSAAFSCVVHEMGHYVDYRVWIANRYGFRPSKDATFVAIYARELDAFKSAFDPWDHNVSDATEFFAEAFSAYCNDPSTLQANCPNTYDYLVKYMEQ